MPKIRLKPNSAEFDDGAPGGKATARCCDMPSCAEEGTHKAPKDRNLKDYYWFCLAHVQEYNKAWNFFAGMSPKEMEEHFYKSLYGDRPTWRYDTFEQFQQTLKSKVWDTYHYSKDDAARQRADSGFGSSNGGGNGQGEAGSPEYDAMMIMGLTPPLTLDKIKTRYKALAKQYHPDLNPGDREAEELLKSINMSYTILKLSYEKYARLQDRKH